MFQIVSLNGKAVAKKPESAPNVREPACIECTKSNGVAMIATYEP
jgi:hypothetical protein